MPNNTILDQKIIEEAAEAHIKHLGLESEETSEEKKVLDKTEQSAVFINQAHKEFRKLVFALADRKKHAPSRVLEAVLFEPLEQVELLGKQEKELFDICQKVMYHKGILMEYAFNRFEQKKKGEINESEEKEMA